MKKYFTTVLIQLISLTFLASILMPSVTLAQCTDSSGAMVDCSNPNAVENAPNTGSGATQTIVAIGGSGASQGGSATLSNPLGSGNTTLGQLIHNVYTAFLTLMSGVLALYLVYCGYLFVVAQGNSDKIKKAKENLYFVLLGGALILGAWTLSGIISSTLTSLGS